MRPLTRILVSAAILLPAMGLFAARANGQAAPGTRLHRPGVQYMRGAAAAAAAAAAPESPQPNMTYYGGTVLPSTTTYAIWWGKPSDFPSDARGKIEEFLEGLDGSVYLAIADQYMLGEKAHTHFGGNFFDDSAPPAQDPAPIILSGNDIIVTEIAKVVSKLGMKLDPTAIYMVYTSNFPNENIYCAFHNSDFAPDGITGVNYAYLPNMTNIPGCRFPEDPFIARNPISQGTRDVASATAHEFMESITDVYFDAWHDQNYTEVGDPCAFLALSGVPLEGSKWELQPIWSNQVSGCVQGGSHDVRIVGALSSFGGIATFDIPDAAHGTFAESINQDGASVGSYQDADLVIHAFTRDNLGHITMIDPPGAASINPGFPAAQALGINADGVIAGYYGDTSGAFHGFVRDIRGKFTTFDAQGAVKTFARSINNGGAVAGRYIDVNLVRHGYVRDIYGNFATFDAPGAGNGHDSGTWAESINNEGAVTGYYLLDTNSPRHGFVRDSHENFATFDAPGASHAPGAGTVAFSINDEGVVAGYFTDARFVQHAFLCDERGNFTTFDAPGAAYGTVARAINAQGLVAGYFSDEHGNAHGFVRDKYGNFKTFGALATSLNAKGAIAGYYSAPIR
jgi:uncharacterized membrane protein